MSTVSSPLEGIRVLDFTSMISGPVATRMLADLGAQVIKVEAPEGDHIRSQPPLRDGCSAYFGHLNCGKQSIVIDLKNPSGQQIARSLAGACDVLVQNARPGVMKRLGLDYDTLAPLAPRLIYCSISGFGQTGADAQRAAYAQVVHAASGHDLAQMSYLGLDRPPNAGIFTADVLSGSYAINAIQAAIIHRYRTGAGQHLDVTLIESMLNLLIYEMQEAQFPAERRRNVYRPLRASDGFLMIVIVSQANFENLAGAVQRPDWKADPRFATAAGRLQNWDALMNELESWTMARPIAECEAIMDRAGVPTSRYLTPRQAMQNDALRERHAFASVSDAAGSFLVPNPPFRMSGGDARARPHVPSLGEHTEVLLSTVLAHDSAQISRLKADGAFGKPGNKP